MKKKIYILTLILVMIIAGLVLKATNIAAQKDRRYKFMDNMCSLGI